MESLTYNEILLEFSLMPVVQYTFTTQLDFVLIHSCPLLSVKQTEMIAVPDVLPVTQPLLSTEAPLLFEELYLSLCFIDFGPFMLVFFFCLLPFESEMDEAESFV